MSSGTYCVIRDLGLVKGGKGMRHHEVLVTFSPQAPPLAVDCRARSGKAAMRQDKATRAAWLRTDVRERGAGKKNAFAEPIALRASQRCAACHANSRCSAIDIATDVT